MSQILDQVSARIQNALQSGKKAVTVFDLDSTLFDVSPRLEKVLMDFAAVPEHQRRFPEEVPYFKNVKTLRNDWGIKKTLIRAGLTSANPEFQQAVKHFWRERFFSNEYLVYDKPYEGAAEYVQHLHELGSEIHYLTGRDHERMGEGSKSTLLHWGFPLDQERSHLALKPKKGMDDALFKRDWFLNFDRPSYQEIWLFENEPVNVNLIAQSSPDVNIVFFDSTHQGLEEPRADIPKIMNFLCGVLPVKGSG